MKRIVAVCLAGCVLALSGCGQVDPETKRNDLKTIYSSVLSHVRDKKAPPKSVDEVLAIRTNWPDDEKQTLQRLKSGNYGIVWGIDPIAINVRLKKGEPTPIMAWDSSAAKNGGYVLFVNGDTRPLSVAEFAAMPKAEAK